MKTGDLVGSKYRLVTRLGQGGMGAVWSAQHTQTGREFAIKFLHSFVAQGNDDARHRFLQEARASARVNHPSIIDIFDVGETEDGTLYLVMELLDGLSLGDALRVEPAFSVRELLVLMIGSTLALGAAHTAGIVHRDVKPLNIYLHRDRMSGMVRPKVLDFGVSKVALGEDDGVATQVGSLLGSPRYMAPEQAVSAAQADGRSDIWSLGVILYEALTGRFPHEGDSSNAIVIAIATRPPLPILEVAPHLPKALAAIVDDCLKPAETRIAKAEILAERMQELLATHDLSDLKVVRSGKDRKAIKRPDNFVIHTSSGIGGLTPAPGQLSVSLNQRRTSLASEPAVTTPSSGAPAAAEEEPGTLVYDSDSRPGSLRGPTGTLAISTPGLNALSPAAGLAAVGTQSENSSRTSGTSTESVSSMTMGGPAAVPVVPAAAIQAREVAPPKTKRTVLLVGGAVAAGSLFGIVLLNSGSKPEADASSAPIVASGQPAKATATAVASPASTVNAKESATASASTAPKAAPTVVSGRPRNTAKPVVTDPLKNSGIPRK